MTVVGYVSIIGYIFLLIYGMGPLVLKFSNLETSRKSIHTMLFVVWILLDVFFKGTIHQIIIPVLFIILNGLSYRFNLYKSVERDEGNHLGTIYFAIVVTAIMTFVYFFPQYYYCSGIAVFCLTFGDGFAALIGYNIRTRALRPGKSLGGFLACFLASALSVWVFQLFYPVELTVLQALIIGVSAAILELCEWGLDNFSVSIGIFLLCAVMFNGQTTQAVIGIIIAVIVSLAVFLSHSIDYYGSLFALIMVFVFYYLGGTAALIILLCAYGIIALISMIKKRFLGIKKEHGRKFIQIVINGGLGTAAMFSYGFTNHLGLLITALVAVGGCFIDSLSSDLGVLSKKQPYDILKGKAMPAGTSGAVSWLGTWTSLIVSVIIAVVITLCYGLSWVHILILTGLLFGQTVIDTIMGSLMQVKYQCPKCEVITEKKKHCEQDTVYYSGMKIINNNAVNLLSSIMITLIALLIYWR